MTIAETLHQEIKSRIEYEDDGRVVEPLWGRIVRYVRHNAETEREVSPQSIDSTIIFTFSDGSALRVANPDQVCYGGRVTIE